MENVQLEQRRRRSSPSRIDRKFLPIYKNATVLLRPRTGLQDMFFQLDPGTKSAGEIPDGGTIPTKNTAPDVNLDEILSALDGDTQAYLRLLLVGAGQGLKGQGQNLGKLLGSLGPLNKDLDRLNSMVAQRRHELADLVHNLSVLTEAIGQPQGRRHLVRPPPTTPSRRSPPRTRTCSGPARLLPGDALRQRTNTFGKVDGLAKQLGPAFNSLRPFARTWTG